MAPLSRTLELLWLSSVLWLPVLIGVICLTICAKHSTWLLTRSDAFYVVISIILILGTILLVTSDSWRSDSSAKSSNAPIEQPGCSVPQGDSRELQNGIRGIGSRERVVLYGSPRHGRGVFGNNEKNRGLNGKDTSLGLGNISP